MSSTASAAGLSPTRLQTLSILIGASAMLSISMGMRQNLGLFMVPMTRDIGISVSDFTFALAMQNIVWGVTQPLIGAYADRFGCRTMTILGTLLYAIGLVITITATGAISLTIGAGLFIGTALSCTASNLAMAASARTVSAAQRSMVLGIISAFGSFGTAVIAPLAQGVISDQGWQVALYCFIGLTAVMLPAAFFTGSADRFATNAPGGAAEMGSATTIRAVLRDALTHRGYITMSIAFFVCGLQLVFLTTHLPTYLALCGQDPMLSAEALSTIGLFNVAGCYILGWAGGRYPKHVLLGLVYVLRSLALTAYFMTPVSEASTLVFAATMGLLWLGIAPLVNNMVAEMFGLRFMATLTGLAFLIHQIGSFIGAWGGGLIYDALGSYDRAWQVGVLIGLLAGVAQMMTPGRPSTPILRPAVA
jgi:MFS family permease